jgi:hypothetical protein
MLVTNKAAQEEAKAVTSSGVGTTVAAVVLHGATQRGRAETTKAPGADYDAAVTTAKAELRRILDGVERSSAKAALETHAIVARIHEAHPGQKKTVFRDVCRGLATQRANTVKRAYVVVERLRRLDRVDALAHGVTGFNVLADVVLKGLADEATRVLIDNIVAHDTANPGARHTVREVRAMLSELRPPAVRRHRIRFAGDDWPCTTDDESIPLEAVSASLDRWLGAGTRVLSVGCGAARGLEAAAKVGREVDLRVIDPALPDDVRKERADRVVGLDPTITDWCPAVPERWLADLVLLAPLTLGATTQRTERTDGTGGDSASRLDAWHRALRGAKSVLAPSGIVVIQTQSNPLGSDVDEEFAILAAVQEENLAGSFLGRVVVRPRLPASRSLGVRHLSAYRVR